MKRAGLDLSTPEGFRGGDSGPAIVPGNAQASILVKRIKYELEPGMPFKSDRLSQNEISRIADWINAGASYNEGPLRLSGLGDPAVAQSRNDHWAFKPPTRPSIPTVRNASSIQNPIDAFIAAEHEKRGLKPLPPADKRALLRRVYFDLIGLPPTPAECRAFWRAVQRTPTKR